MLVLLQTAIPADGTVVEEGFSKLQVFLQQLIDWGVAAGGNIIGAILIFCHWTFPYFSHQEDGFQTVGKASCRCRYSELCKEFGKYPSDHLADYCCYR